MKLNKCIIDILRAIMLNDIARDPSAPRFYIVLVGTSDVQRSLRLVSMPSINVRRPQKRIRDYSAPIQERGVSQSPHDTMWPGVEMARSQDLHSTRHQLLIRGETIDND